MEYKSFNSMYKREFPHIIFRDLWWKLCGPFKYLCAMNGPVVRLNEFYFTKSYNELDLRYLVEIHKTVEDKYGNG